MGKEIKEMAKRLDINFKNGCGTKPEHPTQPCPNQGTHQPDVIYIPKDLYDCFGELKQILNSEDIERMKTGAKTA
jgi:hypothetical protein